MTRDGPGTGTDTAVPAEGARTSARVGRRVRVLSALSGARRRSVMTAPGEAEVEDTGRPSTHACGTAADQLGRTSTWVLGGSVRVSLRIGPPPSRLAPPNRAEAVVHRVMCCPVVPHVRVTSAQPKISLGNAPPATRS